MSLCVMQHFHHIRAELTETSIGDDVVSVVTLLAVLRLHLPVPTRAHSVRDLLCGLERLEWLKNISENHHGWCKTLSKLYPTSHSEDKTELNPPSEDGWRNTRTLLGVTCMGFHPSLSLK